MFDATAPIKSSASFLYANVSPAAHDRVSMNNTRARADAQTATDH